MKNKINLIVVMFVVFTFALGVQKAKAQALPFTPVEGDFYHVQSSGAYYWYAQGKFHYIQTPNTLNGLFANVSSHTTNIPDFLPLEAGAQLTPNTALLRDLSTGKIYFLRDNFIHHLTSPQIMTDYHFNTSIVRNVSNVNGYTVCTTFPVSNSPLQPCVW